MLIIRNESGSDYEGLKLVERVGPGSGHPSREWELPPLPDGKVIQMMITGHGAMEYSYFVFDPVASEVVSNAPRVFVQETERILVRTPAGEPLADAEVVMTDFLTGKQYHSRTRGNGWAYVPKPCYTEQRGKYILEIYKKDPSSGATYYYIEMWKETGEEEREIICPVGAAHFVDIELEISNPEKFVEDILAFAPESAKIMAQAARYWRDIGEPEKALRICVDAVWYFLTHAFSQRTGAKVTNVQARLEPPKAYIVITTKIDAPLWVGLLFAALVLALGTAITLKAISAWEVTRVQQEVTRQLEVKAQLTQYVKEMLEQGLIDEETAKYILRVIGEAYQTYRNNLGATETSIASVIGILPVVLIMMMVISVIKLLKGGLR